MGEVNRCQREFDGDQYHDEQIRADANQLGEKGGSGGYAGRLLSRNIVLKWFAGFFR